MYVCQTGIAEAGFGRIDRVGPEADKQLVHKSEEEALEAIGGHAIRGDGCDSPSLLHGPHLGQSLPHGHLPLHPLVI